MATARTRKRRTDAAMAAWRLAALSPWRPVTWYARRNPRLLCRAFTDEIGQYQGFSMSVGRSFVAVLHSQ